MGTEACGGEASSRGRARGVGSLGKGAQGIRAAATNSDITTALEEEQVEDRCAVVGDRKGAGGAGIGRE